MRNLYCNVEALRKQVFAAVAKLAYEGGDYCSRMEKLPYEIIPGEVGTYRESIFLERAIVGERIRLAMGLPLRDVTEENMISDGVEASAISEKYYDPPLINIIKYACHACPDTHYEVTQACQGCLAKHCYQSCPKGAIELEHGRARIDQTKCIKCGRCKEACSYQAIIKFLRPCQEACGMNAIGKDQYGRADIDYDKCVNCGQCLVNCPFGAIVDKGQIFQLIHAIKKGEKVTAIIAPAFWGDTLIPLGKYWAGTFCLLGHMFPCMFHFKGGKGILSGGTIAIMIDWRIAVVVWGGFLILTALTRYVSLGSLWAGASFPFISWYCYPQTPIIVLAFCLGGLIVWKHRANIQRLLAGNENKLSFHRKKT